MATINLGAIKFNWKGAYSGATAYVVDDVVESSGSSYICIAATTGNAPPNATYWEQMSSAGTDGTDLTTTLTTQGDLVYYNGSALARLGAGTSGQVLQTNGTGANPSWGSVSSDMVKLADTTITSSTANYSADVFNSTYKTFKVFINGLQAVSVGEYLLFRFRQSNASLTSSDYHSHVIQGYWDFGGTNGVGPHSERFNVNYGLPGDVGTNGGDYTLNYEMTIFNASNSNAYPFMLFHSCVFDNVSPSRMREQFGSIFYDNTANPLSGIEFYMGGSSNIAKAEISIYGIK